MATLAQRLADLASRIAAEIKALPKGTVMGVTGSAPIASTGGATPVISIAAASTSAAGSMSSADKAKLDGIAAGAGSFASAAEVRTGTVTGKGIDPKALKDSAIVLPAGGSAGQILAKASATDFDRAWIDPPSGGGGGGAAPELHPGFVSEHSGLPNWYTGWDAPLSGQVYANGTTLFHPLVLPAQATISRLAVVVQSGAANATVRLGIYASAGGRPTTRLIEAPTVSAAASGTMESVLAAPLALPAGTYWLATHASGFAAQFMGYAYVGASAYHDLGIFYPQNGGGNSGTLGGLEGLGITMPASVAAGQVRRGNASTYIPAVFFRVS